MAKTTSKIQSNGGGDVEISKKRKRTAPIEKSLKSQQTPVKANSDIDMDSASSSDISSNDYSEDDGDSDSSSEADSDSISSDTSDAESKRKNVAGVDHLESNRSTAEESIDESSSETESGSESISDSEEASDEGDEPEGDEDVDLAKQGKKSNKDEVKPPLSVLETAAAGTSSGTSSAKPTFEDLYLKQMTEEFADDIETLRNAPDWTDESLPMLIDFLKSGASHFTEEEKELCMPKQ